MIYTVDLEKVKRIEVLNDVDSRIRSETNIARKEDVEVLARFLYTVGCELKAMQENKVSL